MAKSLRTALVCSAATSLLFSVHAQAQSADQAGEYSGGTQPAADMNEIIVTARKRAESVQDVPVAVTAVNAAMIERNNIVTVDQIATLAPNVVLNSTASVTGAVNMYIRGIGSRETEITQDATVGISIDGVFVPTTAGSLIDVFDVAQVEVLRGPQGTLQGKNATGGVLNVVTARPTGEWGGKIELGYGRFEEANLKGVLNVPIADGLVAGKVSGFFNDGGDYMRNIFLDGVRTAGGFRNWGGRVGLEFTPSDNFDAYLTADYVRTKASQPPNRPTDHAEIITNEFGYVEGPSINCTIYNHCAPLGKYELASNFNDLQTSKNGGVGLTMDWDVGATTITSVSGFRYVNETVQLDNDKWPETIVHVFDRLTKHRVYSQELRAASNGTGPFQYVAGVFASSAKASVVQPFFLAAPLLGGSLDDPPVAVQGSRQQLTTSYAAFAQLNYDITDALTVTVGGRYTIDKKRLDAQPAGEPQNSGRFRTKSKEPTFEAGLQYELDPDKLIYFRFAQGYRAGGINGTLDTLEMIGNNIYEPEFVDSYELGLKTQWLDRRLTLNMAGFYYEYSDMQLSSLTSGEGGSITQIKNVGNAKIWGVELEGNYQPTDAFRLSATIGYLDNKYDDQLINLGHGEINLADITLGYAPKWNGTIGADYTVPFGTGGGSMTVSGDLTFKSKHYTNPEPVPNAEQKAYALVDAALTYRTGDGNYFISLWGKNLTNKYVQTQGEDAGGLFMWQRVAPPRTYGVRVGANF